MIRTEEREAALAVWSGSENKQLEQISAGKLQIVQKC